MSRERERLFRRRGPSAGLGSAARPAALIVACLLAGAALSACIFGSEANSDRDLSQAFEQQQQEEQASNGDDAGTESASAAPGSAGAAAQQADARDDAPDEGTDDEADSADAGELRDRLTANGGLAVLRADLTKKAALAWVQDRAVLVDPDGEIVDPETIKFPDIDALKFPDIEADDGQDIDEEQEGS